MQKTVDEHTVIIGLRRALTLGALLGIKITEKHVEHIRFFRKHWIREIETEHKCG